MKLHDRGNRRFIDVALVALTCHGFGSLVSIASAGWLSSLSGACFDWIIEWTYQITDLWSCFPWALSSRLVFIWFWCIFNDSFRFEIVWNCSKLFRRRWIRALFERQSFSNGDTFRAVGWFSHVEGNVNGFPFKSSWPSSPNHCWLIASLPFTSESVILQMFEQSLTMFRIIHTFTLSSEWHHHQNGRKSNWKWMYES